MNTNPEMDVKRSRANIKAYRSVDYSGFFERLFAWGVDFIITCGLGYILYKLFGLVPAVIISIILDLVIRTALTYFFGWTLGKFLFGVRVISRCSDRLSLLQTAVRELFKYISWIFISLGFVTILFNRRKRAWHDMIACTAVTSGGRDEAEYGRDIYSERPEKWYMAVSAGITGCFTISLLIAINIGANMLLYDRCMLGFNMIAAFPSSDLAYSMPECAPDFEKNLLQIGDVDGNGRYDVFIEEAEEGNVYIRNVRLTGVQPVYGNMVFTLDKPIIQYRLLDIDGDKKDELAVLFEDKTVKIYRLEEGFIEIGAYGPSAYDGIVSFIKGRPDISLPWRLYMLGDQNKLTVIYMEDGVLKSSEFNLPGSYRFTDIDMGIFGGRNYITAVSDSNSLVFYRYDGSEYKYIRSVQLPVRGRVSMFIADMNYDEKNEVFLWSPPDSERPYPVVAGAAVDDNVRVIWNGGRFFDYNGTKYALSIDDGLDIDRDGNLEVYMVSKDPLSGDYSVFVFQNNKILMKVNDFMRALSLSGIE